MTQAPDRLMTAEELLDLPDDGKLYELVLGRLVCMPPSFYKASMVALLLASRLVIFIQQHQLGVFAGADGGVLLARDPDTVRAPDFSFVRAERVPLGGFPHGYWPGAPDLALEVVSPSDRFQAVIAKLKGYLDAGTRLVWAIDPEARTALLFHRESGRVSFIDEDGVLDGEDVLPGFSLPLRDVLV